MFVPGEPKRVHSLGAEACWPQPHGYSQPLECWDGDGARDAHSPGSAAALGALRLLSPAPRHDHDPAHQDPRPQRSDSWHYPRRTYVFIDADELSEGAMSTNASNLLAAPGMNLDVVQWAGVIDSGSSEDVRGMKCLLLLNVLKLGSRGKLDYSVELKTEVLNA